VEGVIELVRDHGLKPEDIAAIEVKVPVQSVMGGTMWKADDAMRNIRERHDWCYIPLLFEMTYPVAVAAVDGELTPRQWTEERIFDPAVREMMDRVTYAPDIALTTTYVREDKLGAVVTIATTDGRTLEHAVPVARGSSENPMDVSRKFTDCATAVIGGEKSRLALDLMSRLDELDDIAELAASLMK
jgi:2-methylcitrate dehydratase PrpD